LAENKQRSRETLRNPLPHQERDFAQRIDGQVRGLLVLALADVDQLQVHWQLVGPGWIGE
jgi:hypothetical protein